MLSGISVLKIFLWGLIDFYMRYRGIFYIHKRVKVWICARRVLHVWNWRAERRINSLVCRKLTALMFLMSCRRVNSSCLYGAPLFLKGWNPNSTWRFATDLCRTRIPPTALKPGTVHPGLPLWPEKQLLSLTLVVPAFCEQSPFEQDMTVLFLHVSSFHKNVNGNFICRFCY